MVHYISHLQQKPNCACILSGKLLSDICQTRLTRLLTTASACPWLQSGEYWGVWEGAPFLFLAKWGVWLRLKCHHPSLSENMTTQFYSSGCNSLPSFEISTNFDNDRILYQYETSAKHQANCLQPLNVRGNK